MPNYCNNGLTVKGSGEEMARFVSRVKETLSMDKGLHSWYPLPADATKEVTWERENGDPFTFTAFSDTGYDTALNMWGTKWGDFDTHITSESDDEIVIFYQTAWSNADRLVARMSKDYPSLIFIEVFQESGVGFTGYGVYKGGVQESHLIENLEFPEYKVDMTDDEEMEFYEKQNDIESDAWDDMYDLAIDFVSELLEEEMS